MSEKARGRVEERSRPRFSAEEVKNLWALTQLFHLYFAAPDRERCREFRVVMRPHADLAELPPVSKALFANVVALEMGGVRWPVKRVKLAGVGTTDKLALVVFEVDEATVVGEVAPGGQVVRLEEESGRAHELCAAVPATPARSALESGVPGAQ